MEFSGANIKIAGEEISRKGIVSGYQTELDELEQTLSNKDRPLNREQRSVGEGYKKLLEKGIKHFSKCPNTGFMSRLCSSETDETLIAKILTAQSRFRTLIETAQSNKSRKRKKTRKRKKPVSKSKKRNKSKRKKR